MSDWIPLFRGWRHALSGLLSLRGESPAVQSRRSENLLRAVFDSVIDPHVALRAVRDRGGRITDFVALEANPSACVFHQLPHEQLIGRSLIELHPASQRKGLFQACILVVETGEPLILDDWMDPREVLGGSQRRYNLRAVKLGDGGDGINQTWRDGTADGLVLSLRLIDDRVAMERQLHEEIQRKLLDSQRLAATVEEIAAVGSWQLDHASGQLQGSLQFHRCMALGEPGAALDLPQFLAAIQPDDQDRFQATLLQARGDGRAFEEHVRVPIGGQSLRQVVIHGVTRLDASGRPLITEGTVQDVSELENLRCELEKREWLDPTTGLPNRAASLRQIQQLIAGAEEQPLAIINLAIDNFQRLNETFGCEYCTHLLCRMGDVLRRQLRDADWVAQTGSDEFLVIRAGIASIEGARDLAQQLQQGLATSDLLGDEHPMGIPVSIGVSLWPGHASSAEGLLQAANTALTEAKRLGPRQLQLYSIHISEQIQERIQMELALGRSLSAEQLSIAYQPQVNSLGQIVAAEALLRWHGADGVAISTETFIPIAEETGLIHPIGEWVINACFRQLAQWRDAGLPKLSLAINLSPVQLEDPAGRLSRFVMECLRRHGIDPQMVEFELTEMAIQKNPEAVSREFHALAQAGFHLALDDFGTGYSSLELLHRLPFRKLKIDRCFVDPLLRDDVDLTIVHASLLMAQRLGLSTVAEGVSDREQVRLLTGLGCELFQGYLYSPPVTAEAFEAMMRLGVVIPNEREVGSIWPA